MKLKYEYFTGQVFDLDQRTMNRMIEDVHTLKAQLEECRAEKLQIRLKLLDAFDVLKAVRFKVCTASDEIDAVLNRLKE